MRCSVLMESVTSSALACSKGIAPPSWGLRRLAILPAKVSTRTNWKVKSLVAIRPLGGRPRVEPSTRSGVSMRAEPRGTTLTKRSPSGAIAMLFIVRVVSIASRASAGVTGCLITRENGTCCSVCGRSTVRPVRISIKPRAASRGPSGMLIPSVRISSEIGLSEGLNLGAAGAGLGCPNDVKVEAERVRMSRQ